jgi:hypothetical protein
MLSRETVYGRILFFGVKWHILDIYRMVFFLLRNEMILPKAFNMYEDKWPLAQEHSES